MIDDILKRTAEKMSKTVVNLGNELNTIRTGRASSVMLERIMVDYYGVLTPIIQLASIKSPDAHLLVVEPYDKQALSEVSKAIQASDLGITPSSDGNVIRLPFPPPTEERRKELVKQCRQIAEDTRVAIRNERRDANARLQRLIKEEDVSKDDVKAAEDKVQKMTDEHVSQVDNVLKDKEAEVMEV
ncbi:MAG: ribosome recycling factor [Coriobacteriales bacterium]|jgi:ribosome recycling factor|nr:ribosome recycling factor [Coriobacteriales bacterium]